MIAKRRLNAYLAASWAVAATIGTTSAQAQTFVPDDVLICTSSADLVDPEFEPAGGPRLVFTTSTGDLRMTSMKANGTLGGPGCTGTLIDTGVLTKMPGVPFGQGPEWANSQGGKEIVYTKGNPDGTTSMWRAWLNGGLWQKAAMTQGESRGVPMASIDATDLQYRVKYLRRLSSGKHVPMWRENEIPSTETAWPAAGNESSAGVPRWVPGRRALTTLAADASGFQQAAIYWLDTKSVEVLTSGSANKDEVWMFQAPEFANEYLFITIANSCCLKVYRQIGGVWTVINSLDAPTFAAQPAIFSPEPFVFKGRTYVAMQIGASKKAKSSIWIAAIDPAKPLFRQVSNPTPETVRYEPEWYVTSDGLMVYYSQLTNDGKASFRKASTGLK